MEVVCLFYRVKQFLWGLTARLTDEQRRFVKTRLNDYEQSLFDRLPAYEQLHAVRVAEYVQKEGTKNEMDEYLIKVALLHDIGKIDSGLTLVTKSVLVLLDHAMPSVLHRLEGLKPVNAYYHHPNLAKKYLDGYDEEFLYYVLNHHTLGLKDGKLQLLQRADSNN